MVASSILESNGKVDFVCSKLRCVSTWLHLYCVFESEVYMQTSVKYVYVRLHSCAPSYWWLWPCAPHPLGFGLPSAFAFLPTSLILSVFLSDTSFNIVIPQPRDSRIRFGSHATKSLFSKEDHIVRFPPVEQQTPTLQIRPTLRSCLLRSKPKDAFYNSCSSST